jgi:hypothetical protein
MTPARVRAATLFACVLPACVPAEELGQRTSALEGEPVSDEFEVQGLAGKCLALDPKKDQVVLARCDASLPERRVQVLERADRLVELRVLDRCVQPRPGEALAGASLVALPCSDRGPNPVWMLDGDSIRLAPTKDEVLPDLMVAVLSHSGADGSPLGLAPRRLDEADYWEFVPLGRSPYPTSGFVPVGDEAGLRDALASALPGTVVEIEPGARFTISAGLGVGPRVTVRSGRRNQGRREHFHGGTTWIGFKPAGPCADQDTAFFLQGEGARVTGFKLDLVESCAERSYGVMLATHPAGAVYPQACDVDKPVPMREDVDHMDMEGWTGGAVNVWGQRPPKEELPLDACRCGGQTVDRVSGAAWRNYLHHNNRDDTDGYGVVASGDAHASVLGNTFLHNRHAIAAAASGGVSYWATGNLVHLHGHDGNQDFDVHGTGDGCSILGLFACGARGGIAGEWIEVAGNTFFGADRNNFYLRGTPCVGARFADNVTRQQHEDGYLEFEGSSQAVRTFFDLYHFLLHPDALVVERNRFEIADPTADLEVGDFDGDGLDDLLLATGAAHYVSFSGQTAWHFRALATEQGKQLRLGDFDGDGRADVVRDGPDALGLQIRFGGEGDWTLLRAGVRLADVLVGRFDGDPRADLILTDGATWQLASAGVGPWQLVRTEPRRAADFRVGRLDAGERDDVFGVFPGCGSDGCWGYFPDASLGPVVLGPARAAVDRLRLVDVDGDGRGDVVRVQPTLVSPAHVVMKVELSLGGATAWSTWLSSHKGAVFGRFDGGARAVALYWDSLGLRHEAYGQADQYWGYFEMF